MAKLNTKNAHPVAKLINPDFRAVVAIRSDGALLGWSPFGWKKLRLKVKKDKVDLYVSELKRKGWQNENRPPTYETLKKWLNKGISYTPICRCKVEPDGTCEHGRPSWHIVAGWIEEEKGPIMGPLH